MSKSSENKMITNNNKKLKQRLQQILKSTPNQYLNLFQHNVYFI